MGLEPTASSWERFAHSACIRASCCRAARRERAGPFSGRPFKMAALLCVELVAPNEPLNGEAYYGMPPGPPSVTWIFPSVT
jgi:hypothetical protein